MMIHKTAPVALSALLLASLAGCSAAAGAAQTPVTIGPVVAPQSLRSNSVDPNLLDRLKDSKHTLLDGVRQAEQTSGFAISAKFETEGTALNLSVYTAREGRERDALHNTLIELNGAATETAWTPGSEVFQDVPHVSNAAMHLTLMQLSRLTLSDVINKAAYYQKGMVYSAIPAVRDSKALVDVLVATSDSKSVALVVDLRTGAVSKQ